MQMMNGVLADSDMEEDFTHLSSALGQGVKERDIVLARWAGTRHWGKCINEAITAQVMVS